VSFVANLKGIQGGNNLAAGLTNAGGGAGIPVHVTNWGGTAGASMMPGIKNGIPGPNNGGNPLQPAAPLNSRNPLGAARTAVGNLTAKQYAGGVAAAGLGAAIVEIPQMLNDLRSIDQDQTLTTRERGEAKGGVIGDATGSIIGAAAGGAAGIAAGAAVGAAVGSVVPVLGTAVGALVGAGIGALGMWLGGQAGHVVGTAIGGSVASDDEDAARSPGTIYDNSVVMYPGITPESPGIAQENTGANYPEITNNTTVTNPVSVNDLIITPQGRFNTHPDDYIIAMKNPAALVNAALPGEIRSEVRTVERVPPALVPVVVEGEIKLNSELTIDDKGYRLRQSVGKNTTPYKFAVGSAKNARLIQ
jgi:hypothetical protein